MSDTDTKSSGEPSFYNGPRREHAFNANTMLAVVADLVSISMLLGIQIRSLTQSVIRTLAFQALACREILSHSVPMMPDEVFARTV